MDSLTQITLGAAVGEMVLGRKAGNRAMLWGAIGGTLPDIDVLAGLGSDEISSLAFHRGITHSLTFAVLVPPALGWLIHRLYVPENRLWAPGIWKEFARIGVFMFVLLMVGAKVLPIPWVESVSIAFYVGFGMLFFPAFIFVREKLRRRQNSYPEISWKEWSWLLFWAIITHPLLDGCTTFGTQLFQPFSDYRVAWNNISVVDPAYTLPFLICVIAAARFTRDAAWRHRINYLGIGLSLAYMLFTFFNLYKVEKIYAASLQKQGISYERLMVSPTIFNNILWHGVAETDSALYIGSYSLYDQQREVRDFRAIPKQHGLLRGHSDDRDIAVLRWFSKGYFSVGEGKEGHLIWSDWRYGSFSGYDKPPASVFTYSLIPQNGELKARQSEPEIEDAKAALQQFWQRLKGETQR
jgi:inner membrane protein